MRCGGVVCGADGVVGLSFLDEDWREWALRRSNGVFDLSGSLQPERCELRLSFSLPPPCFGFQDLKRASLDWSWRGSGGLTPSDFWRFGSADGLALLDADALAVPEALDEATTPAFIAG